MGEVYCTFTSKRASFAEVPSNQKRFYLNSHRFRGASVSVSLGINSETDSEVSVNLGRCQFGAISELTPAKT